MSKRAISVFDLDHTLLTINSSFRFGLFLCQRGSLGWWQFFFILSCQLGYTLGFLSVIKLHDRAFQRLFLGRPKAFVDLSVEAFLDSSFERFLYLPAMGKLKEALAQGHLTMILSSSPDFLVAPIAKRLGVSLWRATNYAVDKDQRFCHISFLMLGEHKAEVLHKLRQSHLGFVTAYSDSHLDLPLLLAADKAVGVNPNRRLRRICKCKHWSII